MIHSVTSVSTGPNHKQLSKPHWSFSPKALSTVNRVSVYNNLRSISQTARPSKDCECFNLYKELVPYSKAWSWQRSILEDKRALIEKDKDCPDTLIILQHDPVYTLGTNGSEKFLNFNLKEAPYEVYRTERGGEVTYHGPGQLVMYPIINLRNHKMDLHWYLRALEEVVIRVLSKTFSIKAARVEGLTGVWVGNQKLAAIGIRATRWITYHGLALNVTTDLAPFQWIVPCGIRDRQVGRIKELINAGSDYANGSCLLYVTQKSLIEEFSEVFQLRIHYKNPSELEIQRENVLGSLV